MVIRRSAAGEIRPLVEQLVSTDSLRSDAASARLAIIGRRAVGTLTEALAGGVPERGRVAILRTLETIGDPRALAPASSLVDDPSMDVATAAVGVLGRLLRHPDSALGDAAFERLTAVTLDPTRPEAIRAAAIDALSALPPHVSAQVLRALDTDPSARLRALAARPAEAATRPATLAQIVASATCPEPRDIVAVVGAEGASAPLSTLGRLVDLLRERERAETASTRRTEWQAARAAVHQALAARGSRLALYDLRETLAAVPGPLPVGFLAALERLGDASCLPELAAAYVRARRAADDWWVEHLAAAFRGIIARERLTRRSPAMRQVLAKWPDAAAELLKPRR